MTAKWLLPLLAVPSLCAQEPGEAGSDPSRFLLARPVDILPHEESKTYYLYTSAGPRQLGEARSGVVAYKSKDLETWEGPHVVLKVPDGIWANPAHGAWASEVHFYRGKYYVFVTLHNRDTLIEQPAEGMARQLPGQGGTTSYAGGPRFSWGNPLRGPSSLSRRQTAAARELHDLGRHTLGGGRHSPGWLYCHEWIQILDGTVEAIPLSADLSRAVGEPIYLFKGSDAPWFQDNQKVSKEPKTYVTDGPELYRTKTGKLLMLWSAYRDGLYVETVAHSLTGRLRGPWRQGEPLVGDDSGHGMLFRRFSTAV